MAGSIGMGSDALAATEATTTDTVDGTLNNPAGEQGPNWIIAVAVYQKHSTTPEDVVSVTFDPSGLAIPMKIASANTRDATGSRSTTRTDVYVLDGTANNLPQAGGVSTIRAVVAGVVDNLIMVTFNIYNVAALADGLDDVQVDEDGSNAAITDNILTQTNGFILSAYNNQTAATFNMQTGADEILESSVVGGSRYGAATSSVRQLPINGDQRLGTVQTVRHHNFSSGSSQVIGVSVTFRPYHDNLLRASIGVVDDTIYYDGDENGNGAWADADGSLQIAAHTSIAGSRFAAGIQLVVSGNLGAGNFPEGVADARLAFQFPAVATTPFPLVIEIEDTDNAVLFSGGDPPSNRVYLDEKVTFTPEASAVSGDHYVSPDLSAIFQQLILSQGAENIDRISIRVRPEDDESLIDAYSIASQLSTFTYEVHLILLAGDAPVAFIPGGGSGGSGGSAASSSSSTATGTAEWRGNNPHERQRNWNARPQGREPVVRPQFGRNRGPRR